MSVEDFKGLFKFDPKKAHHIGVEREYFLNDKSGLFVPRSKEVLDSLRAGVSVRQGLFSSRTITPHEDQFGYELSACQVESRDGPCLIQNVESQVTETGKILDTACKKLGLRLYYGNVAPETMPLDVYPDPSGRYQTITKNMPRETLLAACRVIATHIHVGMRDHAMALQVYNRVIKACRRLSKLGDSSSGKRLAIYRIMAPDADPKPYQSWDEYYEKAQAAGFAKDPRKCWSLIRISKHGTIEFRVFGATSSPKRIANWARVCLKLCEDAM